MLIDEKNIDTLGLKDSKWHFVKYHFTLSLVIITIIVFNLFY